MTNIDKENIGSFIAIDRDNRRRIVVVSQENVTYYNKDSSFTGKYLNLDHIDGPEVFKTKNPKIFKLYDGNKLRKRESLQESNRGSKFGLTPVKRKIRD